MFNFILNNQFLSCDCDCCAGLFLVFRWQQWCSWEWWLNPTSRRANKNVRPVWRQKTSLICGNNGVQKSNVYITVCVYTHTHMIYDTSHVHNVYKKVLVRLWDWDSGLRTNSTTQQLQHHCFHCHTFSANLTSIGTIVPPDDVAAAFSSSICSGFVLFVVWSLQLAARWSVEDVSFDLTTLLLWEGATTMNSTALGINSVNVYCRNGYVPFGL